MFLISGGSIQAQRDNCFDFGQWLDIIRAPQDHYFIKCNNGTPVCQRCAADLHWSPKCQRCEYYKDGKTLIHHVHILIKKYLLRKNLPLNSLPHP